MKDAFRIYYTHFSRAGTLLVQTPWATLSSFPLLNLLHIQLNNEPLQHLHISAVSRISAWGQLGPHKGGHKVVHTNGVPFLDGLRNHKDRDTMTQIKGLYNSCCCNKLLQARRLNIRKLFPTTVVARSQGWAPVKDPLMGCRQPTACCSFCWWEKSMTALLWSIS